MPTRRNVLRVAVATAMAGMMEGVMRGQGAPGKQVLLPLLVTAVDAPILGPASGTVDQAVVYLTKRATGYTQDDIRVIVDAYRQSGDGAGMDWFLAIGQLCIETGSLTSWWSQRPQRNPAGIGVTGRAQAGTADAPPGPGWTWDGHQWLEGWSFPSWVNDSVPAHLGRLLAYALRDDQANAAQQALINRALSYRPLPASYRGVAPTIDGLNGRWAVPGTTYGQDIIAVTQRMRGG